MRLIRISDYDEQVMQLAKPIYDGQGRILLAANNKIHPKLLERLMRFGVSHIVVEDAESTGITLDEMMDMPTWIDLIKIVQEGYQSATGKKPFPLRNILSGVDKLLSEVKRRPVVISIPVTTLAGQLQLYAHAVNVTLLSLQIAKQLGYNELQLRDLAVGCLLHDIGKIITTDQNKHTDAGFNSLRNIREISLISAHVAFQHHETYDGKGYPRGISGREVHEYAQICGLANRYENLLSKENMQPHEAIEVIMALNGTTFKETIVSAFINGIPPYPPGTRVLLNNGERAIVTRILSNMHRPFIRYLSSGHEISLAEHLTLIVTASLSSIAE
ncbi:MAG: HD domain-containing protein [Gorillibacterium sp.]|nr:HD domain-containing protein [Gorillibacterium sp.]